MPSGPEDIQYVDGPDGPLAYRRSGAGAPVVLLHPLALSGVVWGEFADRLAASADVIAADARGHGASGWDGHPFGIDDLADDVVALLDGLDLPAAHVVGMSMGGSSAISLAGRYPARVSSAFLADTTAWYGDEAPTTWEKRAQNVLESSRQRLVPFQVDRWFTETFRHRRAVEVNRVVGIFLRTDSLAHAEACRALGTMDSRPLLADVTAPTVVVTGVEDYATPPEMGRAVAEAVPGAHARTLDSLRHLSLIEQPDLADLVVDHITAGAVA